MAQERTTPGRRYAIDPGTLPTDHHAALAKALLDHGDPVLLANLLRAASRVADANAKPLADRQRLSCAYREARQRTTQDVFGPAGERLIDSNAPRTWTHGKKEHQ